MGLPTQLEAVLAAVGVSLKHGGRDYSIFLLMTRLCRVASPGDQ